jgi:hypothetical protein
MQKTKFLKLSLLLFFILFVFTGKKLCFASPPNISIFTIRKSGSGLLARLFNLLEIPYRNNHLLYINDLNEFLSNPKKKGIILIRDPRDVCVSGVFWHTNLWVDSGPHGPPLNGRELYLNVNELKIWNDASFDEKLKIAIEHKFPLPYSQINLEYELAKKALKYNNFYLIRFEDLIGSKGGGCDQKQYEAIKKMLSFLKIKISEKKINYAIQNLFGGSDTFRKGQINSWKNHFKPEHIKLFKEKMNYLLLEWNYENTWDWDLIE